MKKKIIDKQILSALAIGIGAGIILTPVTAEAADGDENTPDPGDGGAVNNNDTTTAATETAQAQEYSEAHEAAQTDVQEARDALADVAADVNTNIAQGDPGHTEAYESVRDAITAADDKVYDASQNLENTENVAETVDNLITDAQQKDTSLQNEADTAAGAYAASTNNANAAAEMVENIDVETTSLEDAKNAVSGATELLNKAEQEKAAADASLEAAEAAATEADNAISAIENAIEANEAELTAAKENLESAEQDLLAAKETMAGTKPTADDKNRVNNSIMHSVIQDIETLSSMPETDERYKDTLERLYGNILFGYVLDEFEFPTKSDYDRGKFSFTYSFEDGVLTIILPALEEGFYTTHMVKLVESDTVHIVDTEDINYKYAIDTADKSSFIEAKSSDYVTVEKAPGSTMWFEYELIEDTEEIVNKELIRHQGQDAQGIDRDSDAITLHKQAQFTKYKYIVKTETVPKNFRNLTDIAKAYAEGYFDTLAQGMYNNGDAVSLDTDYNPTGRWPGYSINGNDEDGYTVTMYFKIKENSGETVTLTATETYWAPLYQHTGGYDQLTYSTDKGKIKKDIDAQKNAEAAIEKAEKAVTDYNTAIEKVTEAKASVDALQEKGEALFSELRDKADKEIPNNTLAHSRLSIAQAAKQTAEAAIESARQAIANATAKVKLINDRTENGQTSNEGGSTSGGGSGSGSTGDGGSNGNNGTAVTPAADTVTPASDPAASPSTINSVTPVLAIGTDNRAALLGGNRTQFYKSLSEELTRQILDQKNAGKNLTDNENIIIPGDVVNNTATDLPKPEILDRTADLYIADPETPLAESGEQKSPETPLALALLFAAAAGITVEEYYRRKAEK